MSLIESIKRHPFHTAGVVSFAATGAALAFFLLSDELGVSRRVLGGGILGALSWFMVSFGSLIGDGD
ncbi:MAG: hypothetical protein OSB70_08570 [Myxococcota bacterium]|nr:hypothetical protein [Myxococcota bacterium]